VAGELRRLPGPIEFLNLPDGGVARLRIVAWERGSVVIRQPRPEPAAEKEIPILRVHLAPGVKPYPPLYWNLSSKTLAAQLLPFLERPRFEHYEYVVTKYGVAPKARYTVERVPL